MIHYGKQVGTRIKRSDGIFRMLLTASNREKYGPLPGVAGRAGGAGGGGTKPRYEDCLCELSPEERERRGKEAAERMMAKLKRKQEQLVKKGYVRAPDGRICPPGWGPVTEEAKQLAALPAEVWERANARGVLPLPDGTVPDGTNATGCGYSAPGVRAQLPEDGG